MRDTFIEELTILAESDRDVTLITGDLGFGVLDNFRKKFPKQYLNAGVAEQNMTTVAAGMAIEGKKVFTYSIGNFPTLRCLEQIRVDICYHDLNVTVVSIGGGFSYGSLGMTHHATEDLSIMRALPNMKVISPNTLKEVRGAVKALYEQEGPSYLRLDKSDAKVDGEENKYQLGKASRIRDGEAITLIACGSVLEECIEASNILSGNNYLLPVLKPNSIFGSIFISFSLFIILFKDILLSKKIIIQTRTSSYYLVLKVLKMISSKIQIVYDSRGASAEKFLLCENPSDKDIIMYNKKSQKQIDQIRLADIVFCVSEKLKGYHLKKDSS